MSHNFCCTLLCETQKHLRYVQFNYINYKIVKLQTHNINYGYCALILYYLNNFQIKSKAYVRKKIPQNSKNILKQCASLLCLPFISMHSRKTGFSYRYLRNNFQVKIFCLFILFLCFFIFKKTCRLKTKTCDIFKVVR